MAKRNREETKGEEKEARKRAKKDAKEQKSKKNNESEEVKKSKVGKSKEVKASEEVKKSKVGKSKEVKATNANGEFTKKKIEFVVSLLPATLKNTEKSVEDSIRQLLLKYSDGIGGILLAFDKVKLKVDKNSQGRGWILNELPYIHYNVSCDALVFCPTVGCKLTGVVNECFPSHIGILVHSYFNAMVSADHLRAAGYSFEPDLQIWASSERGSQTISNQDKISFEVDEVHEVEGAVSLEGVKPSLSLLVETEK